MTMMIASPAVGKIFLFLLLALLPTIASSSSTVINNSKDQEEAYSKLPPTVFAPDGRLFGVERVAREAMMGRPSSTAKGDQLDEDSCCTVFAIRCGRGSQCKVTQGKQQQADNAKQIIENTTEDYEDEFAVVVGIGPISPFLHRDMEMLEQEKQQQQQLLKQEAIEHHDDDEQEAHHGQQSAFYKPLVLEYNTTQQQQQQSLSSMSSPTTTSQLPISILSPSLITAVGGTSPIDSTILLRRSIEVALSMYKLDNGGVHFFASHSLESDSNNGGGGSGDNDGSSSSGINVSGGASGVQIESLVRRIADMAQSSTQNLGGKYGRMLSSSLLAVGNDNNSCQNDEDRLCIWRVDPTGQFWKCEASAAGYGTMEVEAELLSRARAWKKSITMNEDDESSTESKTTSKRTVNGKEVDEDEEMMNDDVIISNEDIHMYLTSLTEDEAVKVASDCLVDGLLNCNRSAAATVQKVNNNNEVSFRDWKAYDLRRRMQCVVLRRSCSDRITYAG